MSSRSQDALCVLRVLELGVYLFRYTSYWHHALILIIIIEFVVLKSVLILRMAISLNSSSAFVVFLFMVVMAGAAGLGVAIVSLMARAGGDDSIRVYA